MYDIYYFLRPYKIVPHNIMILYKLDRFSEYPTSVSNYNNYRPLFFSFDLFFRRLSNKKTENVSNVVNAIFV